MLFGDSFLGVRVEKCGDCSACKGLEKGSGDFTDCMTRIVPAAKPDDPEAFCADYEHRQTGHWPGEKRASIHRDAFLDGPGTESLQKMWSDEARAAAAAARQAHSGAAANQSTQGGAEVHTSLVSHGWQHAGPTSDGSGDQMYTHPGLEGHTMTVQPNGEWHHTGPGELHIHGTGDADAKTYLAHLHSRTTSGNGAMPKAA
jgi:hypothetical protein